jgi:hypothetical protein
LAADLREGASTLNLAVWRTRQGGDPAAGRPRDVAALLAPDEEDAEPEDLLVEETVQRLLRLTGLAVPEDLSGDE